MQKKTCERALLLLAVLGVAPLSAAGEPAWVVDPTSGLQWTRSDNGHDINYPSAQAYCTHLALEGEHHGEHWRLPTREELASLFDREGSPARPCGDYRCPVRLSLELSAPWFWTSEPINAGKAWGVGLTTGQPIKLINDYAQEGRALCVSHPEPG